MQPRVPAERRSPPKKKARRKKTTAARADDDDVLVEQEQRKKQLWEEHPGRCLKGHQLPDYGHRREPLHVLRQLSDRATDTVVSGMLLRLMLPLHVQGSKAIGPCAR